MCFPSTYEGGKCYRETEIPGNNSKRVSMRDTSGFSCLQRAHLLMEPLRERQHVPPKQSFHRGRRKCVESGRSTVILRLCWDTTRDLLAAA